MDGVSLVLKQIYETGVRRRVIPHTIKGANAFNHWVSEREAVHRVNGEAMSSRERTKMVVTPCLALLTPCLALLWLDRSGHPMEQPQLREHIHSSIPPVKSLK